jgi:hypothetical protein
MIRTAHVDCCSSCGQPILRDDLALPPIKARILDIVRNRPGIDAETLRTMVWAHDPGGGPENRKTLHVHICQLNKRLSPLGLKIRGALSTGYRVISIPAKGGQDGRRTSA